MKVHIVVKPGEPIRLRSQRTINEETIYTDWGEAPDKHVAATVVEAQYEELSQLWIPGLAKKERAGKARVEVQ